jgi:uncharacterized membrane protein YqjE
VEPPIDNEPELVDEPDPGPIRGLFRSLANLLATAIGIAHTRLELLSTELQEEVHRAAEILIWTIVAILAALIGLFMLALVIIFIFWDTHRIVASIGVTGGLMLIAVVAAGVLPAREDPQPTAFVRCDSDRARERPREPHAAALLTP